MRRSEISELAGPATILELGAGSGRFSEQLAASVAAAGPRECKLLAVEPAGSVERLARRAASFKLPTTVVRAAAEALPLGDQSVDAVVVAQAFHWFPEAAVGEIDRVLRRGGPLALYWNIRSATTADGAFVSALSQLEELITDAYHPGTPRQQSGEWRAPLLESGLFGHHLQRADVPATWGGPLADCVDGVMSVSGIATRSERDRKEIKAEVRRLLRAAAAELGQDPNGELCFPCVEELWWTRSVP